jgi:diguanylate cyclase (GGDEF)-like protein
MIRRALGVCLPPAILTVGVALGPLRNATALEGGPFRLSFLALLAAFVVAELVAVEVESRNEAHSINFVEFVYVGALLLGVPVEIVLARPLATVVAMGLVRRQSVYKLLVNVGVTAGEGAVTCWVFFSLIGDISPTSIQGWGVIYAATMSGYVTSSALVTLAISFFDGRLDRRAVTSVLMSGAVIAAANTALGIVLIGSLWNSSALGWLVVGVVGVLFLLYRAYEHLNERHKSLETLHDFTRGLGGSLELAELERAVVEGIRSILRGEQAAMLLPPIREGAPATRVLALGDDVRRAHVSPTELAADLAILLPEGDSRLFVPGQPLPGWLAEIGVKDAAIVPLQSGGATAGALVVANRLTEVSEFVEDDLRVFETLANHANVALENGRLVAHLQHEAQEQAYLALHDSVTGLPNRSALVSQLERALVRAKSSELNVGLLFISLDTFKEVNDTLGTATADKLLIEVRQRLQAMLPPTATLARFAGDQFAVLVNGVSETTSVLELAEVIHREFDTPFSADAVSLALGASLGVAFYPEHASSAELLLQRADAAGYMARLDGSGIEVYAAESDPYAPRRLALAADLREALAAGEVDVYFQPKVSLVDSTVVGAEALVRWTHPRLGPLSPDQFIPAAEHTGVIRALTLYVVERGVRECRRWRDEGFDLTVSVNLSARNLFDSHLVEDIGRLVDEAGVPASSVTLELTESTVMGSSRRSMDVLEGLHELGVGISVDDFGTGYSSLSHLRQLPVTELKVDKSFVQTMTTDEHDAVIVRALVDLGRSLGLHTVAEGVESTEAYELLKEMGCAEAQGYLLSRPLPPDQLQRWFERQTVRPLVRPAGVVPLHRERRVAVDDA